MEEELNRKAIAFTYSHGPVASTFKRWRAKTTDAIAWKDACRRSDAYKQKIHESASYSPLPSEGLSSMPSSSSFKRQRSSSAIVVEPSRSRRRLKRVSTPHERRTDEEIAEQLMQVGPFNINTRDAGLTNSCRIVRSTSVDGQLAHS